MNLECLIVCVNYDDLLKITLPQTTAVLKLSPVVVTSVADKATYRVAHRHGARVIQTDAFYRDDAAFNKAAALNAAVGSGLVELGGWILTLDADIFLHDGTRRIIMDEATDKSCLYGAPRIVFRSQAEWDTKDCDPRVPVWKSGEIPGYFHLFWAPSICRPWYDDSCEHAGIYDSYFQGRWDGPHRRKLSCPIIHLGELGSNWFGRRTTRWEGESTGQPDRDAIERVFEQHEDLKRSGLPPGQRRVAKLGGDVRIES